LHPTKRSGMGTSAILNVPVALGSVGPIHDFIGNLDAQGKFIFYIPLEALKIFAMLA